MKKHFIALVLLATSVLSGCTSSSISGTVGAVSGISSSAITANPAVGYAIGITMQAATDATIKYIFREWSNEQQTLMANLAGDLVIGQIQDWEIKRTLPIANERGQIQVIRDIDNALVHCREVLFTVINKEEESLPYLAAICKQQESWKWASAEPAVQRWIGLH